jgi:hypothetical protein
VRILRAFLLLLVVVGAGLAVYVRLAPTDAARWHQAPAPRGPGDYSFATGFEAVREIDRPAAEVLAEADRVILATPRTKRVAGSVEEGIITYVTRSLFWGFPDYTTVSISESATPVISFYGRARFGGGDLGVNEARIRGWLGALGLGA